MRNNLIGAVAEWLKAHAWKACKGASPSGVRIPLAPPDAKTPIAWGFLHILAPQHPNYYIDLVYIT